MKSLAATLNIIQLLFSATYVLQAGISAPNAALLLIVSLSVYCVFSYPKKFILQVGYFFNAIMVFGGIWFCYLWFNHVEFYLDRRFLFELFVLFMMMVRPVVTVIVIKRKLDLKDVEPKPQEDIR